MKIGFFLLIGLGLLYFPRMVNWDQRPLSGIEYWASGYYLGKWIWLGYPILVFAIAIPFIVFTRSSMMFIVAMALLSGMFATLTGIIPIPMRRSYGYIHDPKAHRVGLIQLILSTVSLAIFFQFFY